MADQLYIGNFSKGLTDNRIAFNIDNDAFPYLYNFYVWRGRVKRKRGTLLLGQLQIQVLLQNVADFQTTPWAFQAFTLDAAASPDGFAYGNLLTGTPGEPPQVSVGYTTRLGAGYIINETSNQPGATITPGSILFTWNGNTYRDGSDGNLYFSPSGTIVKGSINYATGDISISYSTLIPPKYLTGTFSYYPGLPVMGLRDFSPQSITDVLYPLQLSFDTKYSYQGVDRGTSTLTKATVNFYNTTFYKSSQVPFVWSGQDYQQFWTTNYSGALWATNNVSGMHLLYARYSAGSGTTTITFRFFTDSARTVPFTTLVEDDILWFNEWEDSDFFFIAHMQAPGYTLGNKGTAITITVDSVTGLTDGDRITFSGVKKTGSLNNREFAVYNVNSGANTFQVTAKDNIGSPYDPGTGLVTGLSSSMNSVTGRVTDVSGSATGTYVITFDQEQTASGDGIVQMLTNSIPGKDGIRFYDGDPTSTTGLPDEPLKGWVNFAPPLTELQVSIDNGPENLYYLVGALAIFPFKDRLLFFAPYIQTSALETPVRLQDTVIWSWNGTPYYTISDDNVPSMVPTGQTANPIAYYVDQSGAGGYLPAGVSHPITTVASNEDVLLIGFGGDGQKTRFVYTGNDLNPFLFFSINSELPSQSTFSAITMDKGVIDIGQYGICMTDQQSCERIDLSIPDQVFQIASLQNGAERVNAIRDFFKEWIYFAFPINTVIYENQTVCKFPINTLLLNYRDNTWGLLYENFTTHGTYRRSIKKSWNTLGYNSWNEWREPWNSGSNSPLFPSIIAGNPQGYVIVKDDGLAESVSGTIQAIAAATDNNTQITSINHCVAQGDYLYFSGILGPVIYNTQIAIVISTADKDTFVVDLDFDSTEYLGLGNYTRLSQPELQTKQFPFYWEIGRKVRICAQKYLLETTSSQQCTLNIFLSQNNDNPWNDPINAGITNGLIYSRVLYTCPESTNLGLTPANINLQMPYAKVQQQIWHRVNTSLIGDTVQLGITLSDAQMRNLQNATGEISLHGIHLTIEPSQILC